MEHGRFHQLVPVAGFRSLCELTWFSLAMPRCGGAVLSSARQHALKMPAFKDNMLNIAERVLVQETALYLCGKHVVMESMTAPALSTCRRSARVLRI